MICACLVPCLSGGMAKNNKIMSMSVLFFWLSLAILKAGDRSMKGGSLHAPIT